MKKQVSTPCCEYPQIVKGGGGIIITEIHPIYYITELKPYYYSCKYCHMQWNSIYNNPDLDKFVVEEYYARSPEIRQC